MPTGSDGANPESGIAPRVPRPFVWSPAGLRKRKRVLKSKRALSLRKCPDIHGLAALEASTFALRLG